MSISVFRCIYELWFLVNVFLVERIRFFASILGLSLMWLI